MGRKILKKIKNLIILSLLIVLGYYGYKYFTLNTVLEADIEKVKVDRGDIIVSFNIIGTVMPKTIKNITSPVSGLITQIFAKEGDKVKKGDKLLIVQPGLSTADKFVPIEITSPIDGTVVPCTGNDYKQERFKEVGERVSGSTEYNPSCIMAIADLENMIVNINVDEDDILKIKKGMIVDINIPSINVNTNGIIRFISLFNKKEEYSYNPSNNFPVEVEILNKVNALPNMTAKVKAILNKKEKVLRLPISGLFNDMQTDYVYLYNPKTKKAIKKTIQTGLRNEMYVEVIDGLKENDEVYTDKPLNIENDKS